MGRRDATLLANGDDIVPCRGEGNCYVTGVPDTDTDSRKPLRRAVCGACRASNWIPGDLPPFDPVACTKCGHPVIAATRIGQFELREVVASGGMGTVYRAFDVNLERLVAVKL